MNDKGKLTVLATGGFFAGILNGLLGAGGGILLVFLMSFILCAKNEGRFTKKDVMAISLAVMLPVSLFSAVRYGMSGNLDLSYAKKLIFPAVLGGLIGGSLLNKLKESFIIKIFAVLVIYSGASMILR